MAACDAGGSADAVDASVVTPDAAPDPDAAPVVAPDAAPDAAPLPARDCRVVPSGDAAARPVDRPLDRPAGR